MPRPGPATGRRPPRQSGAGCVADAGFPVPAADPATPLLGTSSPARGRLALPPACLPFAPPALPVFPRAIPREALDDVFAAHDDESADPYDPPVRSGRPTPLRHRDVAHERDPGPLHSDAGWDEDLGAAHHGGHAHRYLVRGEYCLAEVELGAAHHGKRRRPAGGCPASPAGPCPPQIDTTRSRSWPASRANVAATGRRSGISADGDVPGTGAG